VAFEVLSRSPFDEDWLDRDRRIREAAGRHSDFSGTDWSTRDHGWWVDDFTEALEMKNRLETVESLRVTIREQ
jgi:hypothetical protein